MKGIVIYNGKYGATAQYAEWIGETFNLPVNKSTLAPADLSSYDFFVLGSSVYIGKLLLKDWFLQNQNSLRNKPVFFFIVGGTEVSATDVIEKIIASNFSAEQIGRMKIFYLHGHLNMAKLSVKDKIMLKIGAFLTKDKEVRRKMLTEYNDVKKSHLGKLFEAVNSMLHSNPGAEPATSPSYAIER